ncbi:ZSWM1 protein, partial [Rostratula benghalensis]|nr:ZSWM1 protein [Rostratula benghalensis]
RDLEVVIQGLSRVFSIDHSLKSCITALAQHFQRCISESPPDAVMFSTSQPDHHAAQPAPQSLPASGLHLATLACQGKPSQSSVQASLTTAEGQQLVAASLTESPVIVLQSLMAAPQLPRTLQQQPDVPQAVLLQVEPTSLQSSLDPSFLAAKLEAPENPEGGSMEITQRTEECIKQSLRDICTEPALRLCLSEFAVVQKSVQLISTEKDAHSTRILEDAHSVDLTGLRGCTCHFSQVFQLPCRHIMAVLNSYRKTLQPELLSQQWQKKRSGGHQAGQDSADGLLEVLKSSWNESLDKSLLVSFLTAEISRLLTYCSGEEFERRYRTLRELADSWIGPYIEVKF